MLRREDHWDEAEDSRLRLQTAVRLRWLGVIGQLLTVGFVYLVLGFALPLGIAWLSSRFRRGSTFFCASAFPRAPASVRALPPASWPMTSCSSPLSCS